MSKSTKQLQMSITRDTSLSFPARQTANLSRSDGYNEPTLPAPTRVVTSVRTRTGTRLPNWKKVIEAGGNATTSMDAVFDTAEAIDMKAKVVSFQSTFGGNFWTYENTGSLPLWSQDFTRNSIEPVADTAFADNLARAKFYKKLREIQVQFSGPTFLGELRETVHMLRRPASALYDKAGGYLSALKKAKRTDPKHWLKTASGLWLEHSFGWLPLINDVNDAAKAYRRLTTTRRKKIISAGGAAFYDRSRELDGTFGGNINRRWYNGCFFYTDTYLKENVTVRYKGAVVASAEATQWDNWALFGFTPSEFLPTAWELLPWSFLVDYFTNIGDIVSSSVTCYSNVAYANRSVIRKTNYYGFLNLDGAQTGTLQPNSVLVSASSNQGYFRFTRKRVLRDAGGGVPLPTLQLSFDLSSGQLLNVAALLGQARALHPQTTPAGYRPFRR